MGVRGEKLNNPLKDIRQYSPKLTISQLLKFFEKKGMKLTRGMVQNYIRDGLLPPPAEKRFYTHNHVAALTLIFKLKTVFDIKSIQKTLVPLMDDEGIPLEVYFALMEKISGMLSATPAVDNELLRMLYVAELKGS